MTAAEYQNINQTLNSQNTLHISTWRASYGLSFVSILEKNIAIHWPRNVYGYTTQRVDKARSIIQRIIQHRSLIFISMSMKLSVTILSWSESKETGISTNTTPYDIALPQPPHHVVSCFAPGGIQKHTNLVFLPKFGTMSTTFLKSLRSFR